MQLWRLLPLLALLAGCAATAPAPVKDSGAPTRIEAAATVKSAGTYTVKKGDTLYSIALDQGVDYRELIIWNRLDNPNRIRVGQSLLVAAPGAAEKPAVVADGVSEVRPISSGGSPVGRSLDEQPQGAVSPTPTFAETDTEKLKRTPKGGKLPYSEENLAKLKAQEAAPSPAPQPQPVPVAEKPPAPPAAAPAPPAMGSVDWVWPASGKILASFSEGSGEANKGVDIAGKIGEPVQAAAAGKVIYVGTMNKYGNLVIVLHGGGNSSVYAHNSKILVKEGQMVTRGQKIAELGDSDADQPKLHFEIRQQGKPVDPLKFLPPRG
ncbi:MAG: peptidoglycan DD-metalloendopeptidase family protein [Rhodocyclaceae bacterium]|nr:peptidoglycan DD-metalloendopeptidase family protein [Rhodocyclaceae bacterium]MDZ4215686.1 peptidoglycan DD-metalloendopeptidase family protein [Rhodocyclaceae bacterium]